MMSIFTNIAREITPNDCLLRFLRVLKSFVLLKIYQLCNNLHLQFVYLFADCVHVTKLQDTVICQSKSMHSSVICLVYSNHQQLNIDFNGQDCQNKLF